MLGERFANDVIVTLAIVEGEPHMGSTTGKKHPIYVVNLLGMNDSTRTRSYRFDAFRSFSEQNVSPGTVRRAKMARVKSEKTTERLPSA